MKATSHRIVGTGLFALDVVVRTDGETSAPALGGSAGNVLCILGALGWNVTPIGTVGDDAAAETVRRDFSSVRADLRFLVRTANRSTPVIYQHQLNSENGSTHRFSFACPSCGRSIGQRIGFAPRPCRACRGDPIWAATRAIANSFSLSRYSGRGQGRGFSRSTFLRQNRIDRKKPSP